MDDIGEILRQARINKNMTIQDVHEITKILPRYLKAIEEGQWDALPGVVYAKGYIRSYADAVGVDGDFLIRQFDQLLKGSTADAINHEVDLPNIKADRDVISSSGRPQSAIWWVLILVGIVAVTVIGYFVLVWSPNARQESSPSPPVTEQQPAPQAPPKTEEPITKPEPSPPPPPAVQLKVASQKTNSAVYAIITDKERFKAEISATGGPCWVRITADGKKIWEGTMRAGDKQSAEATDKLTIRLGLPKNADIKIEDQALPHVNSRSPYDYIVQRSAQ